MDVTLHIDGDQLDGTFLKLFREMDDETKASLARDVFNTWFKERLQKENRNYGGDPSNILKHALTNVIRDLEDRIKQLGKEDEDLDKLLKLAAEIVKDQLPAMAIHAAQQWFAANLGEIARSMANMDQAIYNNNEAIEELQARLGS